MTQLIDTHAHLYTEQFSEDSNEMVRRAIDAGVSRMYLPNIDQNSIEPMHEICEAFPDHLFPMMGLHPCSVQEDFEDVLDEMECLLQNRTYYGIGETGIDLYWDKSGEVWQKASFARQIEWAKKFDLPIIIHSRSALDMTMDMIGTRMDDRLNGIFHCFDGTVEQAKKIKEMGFFIGIGGVVTYKKSHLPMVIEEIGLDKIVLETDAPYLSPMPCRGKRNESSFILHTARFLADLLEIQLDELMACTTANAQEIFKCKIE